MTPRRPAAAARIDGSVASIGSAPAVWLAIALAIGGCATRPADVARPAPPADATGPAPPAGGVQPAPPVEWVAGGAVLERLAAGRPGPLAVGSVQAVDGDAAGSRFPAILQVALAADLRAIGVLDVSAPTRLDAVVARRNGTAEALVTVTRAGQTRLRKRYRVELPSVANDEAAAVRSLLGDVYDDPEFGLSIRE